jgi:integrase
MGERRPEAALVTIPRTRIMVDAVVCESGPKTDKGHRALPLPDALARVFKRAHQRQTQDRPLLGVDHLEGGYVVADRGGSPMHPETLGLAWARLLTRAGARQLRLHDARHTRGTVRHLRGVPVAVIAA